MYRLTERNARRNPASWIKRNNSSLTVSVRRGKKIDRVSMRYTGRHARTRDTCVERLLPDGSGASFNRLGGSGSGQGGEMSLEKGAEWVVRAEGVGEGHPAEDALGGIFGRELELYRQLEFSDD